MNLTRTLLGALCSLLTAAAFAAVDVNKASQAELEAIKGIGVAASTRILDERKVAPFKDWSDLVDRVRGIGPGNAAKYSADGLTVNGTPYAAVAAAPAKKTNAGASKEAPAAAPKAVPAVK